MRTSRRTSTILRPTNVSVFGLGAGGVQDRFSISFHGLSHTHIDALAHRFFDGKMYNGIPASEVTEAQGAPRASIHVARDGIFTRGVLMDMPALKGVPYYEPGARIFVSDLEAWEKKADVKVQSGDAVFIRVGRWTRRAELGRGIPSQMAGLDASVLPWLKARDIAVLAKKGRSTPGPCPRTAKLGIWRFTTSPKSFWVST